jgi:hypothetical protein
MFFLLLFINQEKVYKKNMVINTISEFDIILKSIEDTKIPDIEKPKACYNKFFTESDEILKEIGNDNIDNIKNTEIKSNSSESIENVISDDTYNNETVLKSINEQLLEDRISELSEYFQRLKKNSK